MAISRFNIFLLLNLLLVLVGTPQADKNKIKPKLTRILFLFDASQSMYGKWQSDLKINVAKNIMFELLDSLKNAQNVEFALRVYGHTKPFPPQDCDDSRLEVAFASNNIEKIKNRIRSLVPSGTTPIAYSLELAAGDFPPCEDCRNIIILITDGIEECRGDPCAVSQELQKKGIVLKPFIIGIGQNFAEAFKCVGTYFDGSTEEEFRKVIHVVISQALNPTTCQINLLDVNGEPTETNVPITLFDRLNGLPKYHFIHTLNAKGLPDTLYIDPIPKYFVQVHTLPPVFIDSLVLKPGQHTMVGTFAGQGTLLVKAKGKLNQTASSVPILVYKAGDCQLLNTQQLNQPVKYLVGEYDLKINTLPPIELKNVKINQSTTTTIEIQEPGYAIFQFPSEGYGFLLWRKEKNKFERIYTFNSTTTQEILYLLPGEYLALFRAKQQTKAQASVVKKFSIEEGQTIRINMSLY
jgi:Ca-activated chloride channel family protein